MAWARGREIKRLKGNRFDDGGNAWSNATTRRGLAYMAWAATVGRADRRSADAEDMARRREPDSAGVMTSACQGDLPPATDCVLSFGSFARHSAAFAGLPRASYISTIC